LRNTGLNEGKLKGKFRTTKRRSERKKKAIRRNFIIAMSFHASQLV
jgi:hypothetical protein